MGDETSRNVPKDNSEVRSLIESICGSDQSSYLDFDLTNSTSW